MKIDDIIEELLKVKAEGNIEVTCTGSTLADGYMYGRDADLKEFMKDSRHSDIFETTVENAIVHDHPTIGRVVRLWP